MSPPELAYGEAGYTAGNRNRAANEIIACAFVIKKMSGGTIMALSGSCANEVSLIKLSIIEHRNYQNFQLKWDCCRLYRMHNGLHVRCGLWIVDKTNSL